MEVHVVRSSSASSPSPKHTSLPVVLALALGIAMEQELESQPHLGGTAGEEQTLPLQLNTCRVVVDGDEQTLPLELLMALHRMMGEEGTLPAAAVKPAGVLDLTGELSPTGAFKFLGVLDLTCVLRSTGVLRFTGVPSSGLLDKVGEEHTFLAVVPACVGASMVVHGTDATWSRPLRIRWPSSGVIGRQSLKRGDGHHCGGRVEPHRERGVVLGELTRCLVSTQASRAEPVEW